MISLFDADHGFKTSTEWEMPVAATELRSSQRWSLLAKIPFHSSDGSLEKIIVFIIQVWAEKKTHLNFCKDELAPSFYWDREKRKLALPSSGTNLREVEQYWNYREKRLRFSWIKISSEVHIIAWFKNIASFSNSNWYAKRSTLWNVRVSCVCNIHLLPLYMTNLEITNIIWLKHYP